MRRPMSFGPVSDDKSTGPKIKMSRYDRSATTAGWLVVDGKLRFDRRAPASDG